MPASTFADSVFQENPPPTPRLDTESGNVFLKYDISSRKEADGFDHTYLKLELIVNSTTQETKRFVTYYLTFTNFNGTNAKPILSEALHTEAGTLLLNIVHSPPPITIPSTREQILNSYKADPAGNVTIMGLSFDRNVIYHAHVDILRVDDIMGIFAADRMPKADFYFSGDMPSSVGEVRVVPEFPIATIILATILAIVILGSRAIDKGGQRIFGR
ncbi:MAG: hypothetical protein ABI347_00180 [Nitrososphaera sp.]